MKDDIVRYKRTCRFFRNQMECGILPTGDRLPSRAERCKEYRPLEITVRRVLKELSKNRLIGTLRRKRSNIKVITPAGQKYETAILRGDINARKDVLNTGQLFCYPAIKNGVAFARQKDWEIPTAITVRMNSAYATVF